MSFTNLLLGHNWSADEWPDYVEVQKNVEKHEDGVDLYRSEYRAYFPVRTCRNVYEERVHPGFQCDNGFMCSACGSTVEDYEHYAITGTFNYCPACGARVMKGEA